MRFRSWMKFSNVARYFPTKNTVCFDFPGPPSAAPSSACRRTGASTCSRRDGGRRGGEGASARWDNTVDISIKHVGNYTYNRVGLHILCILYIDIVHFTGFMLELFYLEKKSPFFLATFFFAVAWKAKNALLDFSLFFLWNPISPKFHKCKTWRATSFSSPFAFFLQWERANPIGQSWICTFPISFVSLFVFCFLNAELSETNGRRPKRSSKSSKRQQNIKGDNF